ncbi:MAG: NUDIX hydrolase [Oscillospiraceae bacterium]|jgi:ADP-ribose pyrophosphatase|nr:NUDIX hydrolase [Oscillospiraceae bacterium]
MAFFEKSIERKTVYSGRLIAVREDTVELDNASRAERIIVEHPGGVAVVAVKDGGSVIMVTQFRYAFAKELLEIPAGKLERGEIPLECAQRELSEETGYSAATWVSLGAMYPSPGYCEETLHLFLATDLQRGEAHPDEDEFLSVSAVPFSELERMILANELPDGKTVCGLLKAKLYLGK